MQFVSEQGAGRYHDLLAPLMFAPSARQLVAEAALPKGVHVLDIATGTGVVARAAAQAVGSQGRVLAIDINPAMLAVARSQPTPDNTAPIEYVESAIERADFPRAAFDAAFCQQGLQFFDEPIRALHAIAYALKPEGHLHIALWGPIESHALAGSMQRALLQLGFDDLTWFLSKAHRLSDPAVVISLLQKGGFKLEEQKSVDVRPDGKWHPSDGTRLLSATPLAPKLATLTPEQRAQLDTACERELSQFVKDGVLDLKFPATFYSAVPA